MLINSPSSSQNLCAIGTGLFDFHKTATTSETETQNSTLQGLGNFLQ